ncbi:YdcH family protein [Sphingomonas sp.]|uniref:YdcH family protein n=1 Tax=Sphingomonas sp. TaxID=28214 RepID=UPI001DA3DE5A|nr:YdcH family protein [Sphingomonas sp.]MBX9797121.1 YdcH family protein [Sphingomonas sp.]
MNSAHHASLMAKHATLDRRIALESQRPLPDALVIADLKKQKLKIKEEMSAH